jgi:hypothetical protein
MAGFCEHGNAHSGSLKGEGSLHYLSDFQLLRKDFVLWNELAKEENKIKYCNKSII